MIVNGMIRVVTVLASFQSLLSFIYFFGSILLYSYDERLALVSLWNWGICLVASIISLVAVKHIYDKNYFPVAIFLNVVSVLSNASNLAWLTIITYELFRTKMSKTFYSQDSVLLDQSEHIFAYGLSLAYTCVASGLYTTLQSVPGF